MKTQNIQGTNIPPSVPEIVFPALIEGKIFLPFKMFPEKYENTSVKIEKKKIKNKYWSKLLSFLR